MDGITLLITGGFNSSIDRLSLTSSAGGITGTYNAATGLLRLRGAATASDYQAALRSVSYTQTTPTEGARTFVVVASKAIYLPSTGNLYEYITTPSSITWTDARAAANAATFGSSPGHLVTITSQAENDVAVIEIQGNTWIGASDAGVENTWVWTDGPETGQTFWTGRGTGTASGYQNWSAGEPNDYGTGEDYAHMFASSGLWNDYPDSLNVQGYLVEYEVDDIGSVASLVRLTIGIDTDGDGVTDGTEAAESTDENDPTSFKDTDGDGVPDAVEIADGTNPADGTSFLDTDHDGLSDYTEGTLGTNALSGDSDGDEVPDGTEVAEGSNPADPTSTLDSDGDGVPDYVETRDGGDPSDPTDAVDTDGDGLSDYAEGQLGTDPNDGDSDNDGALDGDEVDAGSDPLDSSSMPDTDGDGVPDPIEVVQGTDPSDARATSTPTVMASPTTSRRATAPVPTTTQVSVIPMVTALTTSRSSMAPIRVMPRASPIRMVMVCRMPSRCVMAPIRVMPRASPIRMATVRRMRSKVAMAPTPADPASFADADGDGCRTMSRSLMGARSE
ncbi:MAG: lectin-like protein [Acidimicrobiales bacterium]